MSNGAAGATALVRRPPRRGLRRVGASSTSRRDHADIAPARRAAPDARKRIKLPVVLFLIALVIPWIIFIGPLRMTPYRIVLTIAVVPCILAWLAGAAGRIRLADVAVLLFTMWSTIAISAVHGFTYSIQSSGMFFIETAGAYFLARCFIRSADDFYNMSACLFWIIAILLPFALYESITLHNIAREIFAAFYQTTPDVLKELRWGLRRAHTVFEHPILFGVVAGSIFAMTYLVLGYGKPLWKRLFKAGIVAAAAFTSLSSGPLSALGFQGLLIAWDTVLKSYPARWPLLGGLFLAMYVTISIGSNQTVVEFYVHYFAFSEATGWDRILIWYFGWASVLAHPVWGIGFNEYVRPDWMEPSIDMFWLLNAVRYGMPGGFLMLLIFAASVIPVMLKKGLSKRDEAYRLGYLITMAGFFLVGWTVHFWNATYVLFLFLVASGAWIREVPTDPATSSAEKPGALDLKTVDPPRFQAPLSQYREAAGERHVRFPRNGQ